MGALMRNGVGYSNNGTGVLMRNGINYTGTYSGGGGGCFDTVLSAGQISTTSSYVTASFNDISDYSYIFLKVYYEDNGVEYAGVMMFTIDQIPSTGDMNFWITVGSIQIQIVMSRTTIRANNYGGNWRNIYADISATDQEIFT